MSEGTDGREGGNAIVPPHGPVGDRSSKRVRSRIAKSKASGSRSWRKCCCGGAFWSIAVVLMLVRRTIQKSR